MEQSVEQWKRFMQPALDSKTSEMKLMGYSKVTNHEIWDCLMKKVWKGSPPDRLYEMTQDIFHLSTNVYMSYLTLHAQQDDNLMASIQALNKNTNETTQHCDNKLHMELPV